MAEDKFGWDGIDLEKWKNYPPTKENMWAICVSDAMYLNRVLGPGSILLEMKKSQEIVANRIGICDLRYQAGWNWPEFILADVLEITYRDEDGKLFYEKFHFYPDGNCLIDKQSRSKKEIPITNVHRTMYHLLMKMNGKEPAGK